MGLKKLLGIALCLALLGTAAGCDPVGEDGGSTPLNIQVGGGSSPVSSSVGSEPEAVSASPQTSAETGNEARKAGEQVFVQQDSGAEEGYEPTVRLLEGGRFEFTAYCYDGMVYFHGTYREEGSEYVLTVEDNSAPEGAVGSDVEEIRMAVTESGLTYTGEQLGVTQEGSLFEKQ